VGGAAPRGCAGRRGNASRRQGGEDRRDPLGPGLPVCVRSWPRARGIHFGFSGAWSGATGGSSGVGWRLPEQHMPGVAVAARRQDQDVALAGAVPGEHHGESDVPRSRAPVPALGGLRGVVVRRHACDPPSDVRQTRARQPKALQRGSANTRAGVVPGQVEATRAAHPARRRGRCGDAPGSGRRSLVESRRHSLLASRSCCAEVRHPSHLASPRRDKPTAGDGTCLENRRALRPCGSDPRSLRWRGGNR
jgi:hypothetical protein